MRGRFFARFSSKNFPHLIKEIIKGCANYAEGGGDSRGMGETELKSKANLWIDPKVPFPLGQQ